MQKIDIHTHVLPRELPRWKDRYGYGGFLRIEHHQGERARLVTDEGRFFRGIESNCWDAGVRLGECDQQGVGLQVLSTIPALFGYWTRPDDGADMARFLNDHLAELVAAHPARFLGLATLPLQAPALAVRELERCVRELGLAGAQIGSHVNDWDLSAPELFPVFQAAEALDACLFVHPWDMGRAPHLQPYWLPWLVGMPSETALAICAMIFGGVFERLPRLRVAFAHGGGSFPFLYGRIAHGFEVRPDLCAVENPVPPRDYLGRFYVDSLVHDPRALRLLLEVLGERSVALGSDYPFPLGEERPGALIDELPGLSAATRERLLRGTALEWLGGRCPPGLRG
jgi:aminocarboxymuconate-semialdehyde decarboxylase